METTIKKQENKASLEQMNIVVIGHVDHGKSTVVGRLLADTNSLPKGKLEDVKDRCRRSARPFEYAFLLDALKDEQSQGITIDSARCFFKSKKRSYIIIDAPGHIEFLKNMISGAARAEAAVLVIDAKEGVQENSRRHGYLLSILGVKQVLVLVNKLDLVDYSQQKFEAIRDEYSDFLKQINTVPLGFVPVSARDGVNIVGDSPKTSWYNGNSLLDLLDSFAKEPKPVDMPLRLPLQDVYKFTEQGDDRRVFAGRVETGKIRCGDEVVFLPSGKKSKVSSIEAFNADKKDISVAGESMGITLEKQIYVQSGEVMCRSDQVVAQVASQIKVNIFWMGNQPMIKGKRYKLKLATSRVPVWLRSVENVLDASDLTTDTTKQQIERHDVAECIIETVKPLAFDLTQEIAQMGRFVIIDNYEIAGGGVILDKVDTRRDRIDDRVEQRERNWERSNITPSMREARNKQRSTLVLVTGEVDTGKIDFAKALEQEFFESGRQVYYLGLSNSLLGIDPGIDIAGERDEQIRRLGEISHLFTDAGIILITSLSDADDFEVDMIKKLNQPSDCVVVNVGQNRFVTSKVDLQLETLDNIPHAIARVGEHLKKKEYLVEYHL